MGKKEHLIFKKGHLTFGGGCVRTPWGSACTPGTQLYILTFEDNEANISHFGNKANIILMIQSDLLLSPSKLLICCTTSSNSSSTH